MARLMGAHPPMTLDGSSLGGANVNYFQDYKSEEYSHSSMSPHEWGLQGTQYSPKPDLVAANKVRNHDRYVQMPPHNISMIDSVRMKEIDDFYKATQAQREQYKDRTGRLHPLVFFKENQYNYQCAPSMTPTYLSKYPQTYITYKIPLALPPTYERTIPMPYLSNLNLAGVYSRSPCIAYKH